jgi:hypothetical protein
LNCEGQVTSLGTFTFIGSSHNQLNTYNTYILEISDHQSINHMKNVIHKLRSARIRDDMQRIYDFYTSGLTPASGVTVATEQEQGEVDTQEQLQGKEEESNENNNDAEEMNENVNWLLGEDAKDCDSCGVKAGSIHASNRDARALGDVGRESADRVSNKSNRATRTNKHLQPITSTSRSVFSDSCLGSSGAVHITLADVMQVLEYTQLPLGLHQSMRIVYFVFVVYFGTVASEEWFTSEGFYAAYGTPASAHCMSSSSSSQLVQSQSVLPLHSEQDTALMLLFWMAFQEHLEQNRVTIRSSPRKFSWDLVRPLLFVHSKAFHMVMNIIPTDQFFLQRVPKAVHRALLRLCAAKTISVSVAQGSQDAPRYPSQCKIKIGEKFAKWVTHIPDAVGAGLRSSQMSEWALEDALANGGSQTSRPVSPSLSPRRKTFDGPPSVFSSSLNVSMIA